MVFFVKILDNISINVILMGNQLNSKIFCFSAHFNVMQ